MQCPLAGDRRSVTEDVYLPEVQAGLPVVQTGREKVPALREAAWDGHEILEADAAQELEVVGVVAAEQSEQLLVEVAGVVELELEKRTLEEGGEVELEVAPFWFLGGLVSDE